MTEIQHFGDCMAYLGTLKKGAFQLVNSDPPYSFKNNDSLDRGGGIMKKGGKMRHESFQEVKDVIGLDFDPIPYLEANADIMEKFNGYFWTNKHLLTTYINWAEKYNFHWDLLLWTKTDPNPFYADCYMTDKEYSVYIRQEGAYWDSSNHFRNYSTNWIESKNSVKQFDHPTVKPFGMEVKKIKNSCETGATVFDGFGGSGTTASASIYTGRGFITCEIVEKYYKNLQIRVQESKEDYAINN